MFALKPQFAFNIRDLDYVLQFDLRSNSARKLFSCSSFTENKQSSGSIRLNALVIDPRNPNYFALGGSDKYARVYDIRKYQRDSSSNLDKPVNTFCPHHLIETHDVHITSLAFSNTSELLVSYDDELIYLFQKNTGMGPSPLSIPREDLQKLEEPQAYVGHRNSRTIKGVSFFGPHDEYVMSGSDCGHIFIWKKKGAELVRLMVGDREIVNQVEPHPNMPVIATSGIEKNIKVWAPVSSDVVPLPHNVQEVSSKCFTLLFQLKLCLDLEFVGQNEKERENRTYGMFGHWICEGKRWELFLVSSEYLNSFNFSQKFKIQHCISGYRERSLWARQLLLLTCFNNLFILNRLWSLISEGERTTHMLRLPQI